MTREEMLFSKSEATAKLDGINQEIDQVSRSHHVSALVPIAGRRQEGDRRAVE